MTFVDQDVGETDLYSKGMENKNSTRRSKRQENIQLITKQSTMLKHMTVGTDVKSIAGTTCKDETRR